MLTRRRLRLRVARASPSSSRRTHVAFRPIDVKMGPDGALYIADWYNPIIQHGEVDFRDPRRDHTHGRIWRVTAKGRPLVDAAARCWRKSVEAGSCLSLKSPWTRQHAKRDLQERAGRYGACRAGPRRSTRRYAGRTSIRARRRSGRCQIARRRRAATARSSCCMLSDHGVRAAPLRVLVALACPSDRAPARAAGASRSPTIIRACGSKPCALAKMPPVEAVGRAAPLRRARSTAGPEPRLCTLARRCRELPGVWLPTLKAGKLDFGGDVQRLAFALQAVDSPEVVPAAR